METAFDLTELGCYVSTDVRGLQHKLDKMIAQTGEGKCIKKPEDNDGCWYGLIPCEWVKVGLPKKVVLTDEQKQIRAQRMRALRKG